MEGCIYRGIALKWDPPSDMHVPKLKWKIYVFKGEETVEGLIVNYYAIIIVEPIPIYREPGYLFGRDSRVLLSSF
jgi:hypothetical protein